MGGDSLSVPILYEANATDFNNLGLGPLVDTTVATVTEERNGQFILEMQYPVDGIRASLIAKNRILKVDAGHKLKDQRFVIKRINRIMGNDGLSYSIYAEHISYITADYALKPNLTISGSGNVAMTQWLNGIIDSNRIHVDSDIATENTTSWTIDKVQNARQALGGVQGSILDVWGGEYRFDNLNISLLRHRGTVSNTLLSYGRNITDFDQEENITNTYTSIYPFASYSVQNGDTSEQKILTIPDLVVDSEYVNNFPNRKIQVVDFSDKFSTDEKPTVERLTELAKSYIKSNNVGVPTVSTKISFVDLSKTENYKEFTPLEELDLCDEVPFVFDKFGIKTTAKISRIVWNVLLDSYDSLELGELKTNLSDVINNTNNAALDAKDAANDAKNSADNAALSANGKNRNWYGADDPAFGHLSELREGDSWYMPNGEDTELYHWINGQWVFILSTKTANDAADAADKASKEAEEAKKQANKAVDGANDAVAKAGFANDKATQAKSDAAAAGQQAKDALANAKNALTNSSSAQADSAQARKDSATAKIQAANAATQANQAVTDATTAKTDANTAKINATQAINDAAAAKGQAANALGQANTAINNAANALDKFNNMSVGGRNYLLGSATVTPVDNQNNWTVIANKSTDTFNGLTVTDGASTWSGMKYSLIWLYATAPINLQDEYTASIWIRNTSTQDNVPIRFYCDASDKHGTLATYLPAKSDWVRISQTFRFNKTSDQLTWSMRIRFENFVGITTGDGFIQQAGFKLEKGNQATDWSPAPEDVQQQFTDINGELSQKVSQTTYNILAGTVDTVSTLAKQNQSTISTLATKTSVDTVNKTATTAQTLAQQNATELLNKANSTTVDTLTKRVTTAEGKITVQADRIAQTVSKTELTTKLNDYATQTWTQSQIKSTADSINLNVSKVQTDLGGAKTQFAELAVKVDGIQTTVSGKADKSQITQLAGQITSVVGDVSANGSQITQMKADINLRVKAGDVVNQINISPESILIAGQKVHITGQTSIDNAVIKDAMIANVMADKITAGTLNAANVNVINLNANNITTGTIKGANLSMNLNTGEVVFQHGRIHSASNNVDVNIDQGYLSTASNDTRVMLKEGQLQLVQPTIFDKSEDPYLEISNSVGGASFNGANIIARDYLILANRANSDGFFDAPLDEPETFAGLAVGKTSAGRWKPTRIGGADRGIIMRGGTAYMIDPGFMYKESPEILIGTDAAGSKPSDRIYINGSYVHITSAYWRTASGSANLMVARDGALVRSTSASKYKTDIVRTNKLDYGDKLLNLPTATWTDIAETKRYRDDPVNQIKPTRNFGMIAEDLADAGLEMLVVRGTDGELEGINYDRIGPALIPVIAKLKNKIEKLEQKLEENQHDKNN